MIFGGLNILTIGLLLLAMAFGAIVALIFVELHKRHKKKRRRRPKFAVKIHDEAESKRRQDQVVQLMNLYSGVHSANALSDFLNRELERRHEPWRVRIPPEGPGEIYDMEQI